MSAQQPNWFVEFAQAIDADDAFYLHCTACQSGSLPPRSSCPRCPNDVLERRSLSRQATVRSHALVHVTIPRFIDDAPYTVVLARLEEGVQLTGQLRGADEVSVGDPVHLGVEKYPEDAWLLTFTPD